MASELTGQARSHAPGLALAVAAAAAAFGVHELVPDVSALVIAVVLGMLVANLGLHRPVLRPGTGFAAKRLLRVGVVLLGFQLAAADIARLGGPGIGVVLLTVATTFFGTQWLGRRLGVSPALSLLTATGFAICGASAIAAMRGVIDAEEEEVAFSIALVTLCGTLSIALLPLLQGPLGLGDEAFGQWAGAAVHDVAQVVATASTAGAAALAAAVVVKLTRVVLLAPLVAGTSFAQRRKTDVPKPILPLFVLGFLVAMGIRSSGVLGEGTLDALEDVKTALFAAALFGLGTGVELRRLRRLGGRPLVLGLASWALVAGVAYGGVRLVG
jgi:uncharacterized integral membrane protein (TIGR00698 family)